MKSKIVISVVFLAILLLLAYTGIALWAASSGQVPPHHFLVK